MLNGIQREIRNSKDGIYPAPFHKQPMTCIARAELEKLQPNHVVSPGHSGRAEQKSRADSPQTSRQASNPHHRLTDCARVVEYSLWKKSFLNVVLQ